MSKEIALLMPQSEISKRFSEFAQNLKEVTKLCSDVQVTTDESCEIASSHLSRATSLETDLEKLRKQLKEPYHKTGVAIDEYVKTIVTPLSVAKKLASDKVTKWKQLKQAQLKAAEETRLAEIEKERVENVKRKERLLRIIRMLNARLYGGIYEKPTGEPVKCGGCMTIEEIEVLEKDIATKYPEHDEFGDYKTESMKLLDGLKTNVNLMKEQITLLQNGGDDAISAMAKINQMRTDANVDSVVSEEILDSKIEKAESRAVKQVEKQISGATKGVRNYIKWKTVDIKLVPEKYLTVDENEIKRFQLVEAELIKSLIAENKQPIPGIEFYIESTYVARS